MLLARNSWSQQYGGRSTGNSLVSEPRPAFCCLQYVMVWEQGYNENFVHLYSIFHFVYTSSSHSLPPHSHTHMHTCTHSMEQKCSEACSSVEREIEDQCEHWVAELESGGNVKFTAGDPSLPWYKSCSDLTTSRFSVADVEVCVCVCVCVCVWVCVCVGQQLLQTVNKSFGLLFHMFFLGAGDFWHPSGGCG